MDNEMQLRKKFVLWMQKQPKTIGTGCYTEGSVNKCASVLNNLDKYFTTSLVHINSSVFECCEYSDFIEIENYLRDRSDFDAADGKGKGQRWIHNGLLLYGKFLLKYNEINEEDRIDNLESMVPDKDGKKLLYYVSVYERKKKNREAAIRIHGLTCQCCGFDFEKKYGELGHGFIEVHHVVPLSSRNEQVTVDPENDLVCLCSNCHRMVHRRRNNIVSVSELKKLINSGEN